MMNTRRSFSWIFILVVLPACVEAWAKNPFFVSTSPSSVSRRNDANIRVGKANSSMSAPMPMTFSMSMTSPSAINILSTSDVINPQTGQLCKAVNLKKRESFFGDIFSDTNTKNKGGKKTMVVVMEQLGDFDSAEYSEQLRAVLPDLQAANMDLCIIGIGNVQTAQMFSQFTGMPLDKIRVDPTGSIHESLQLHRGPNWDIPSIIPDNILIWFAKEVGVETTDVNEARSVSRAWLNYMAMCAGIAAPGTLPEIIRGYLGDKSAPERLAANEVIEAGPIEIKGITDVKIGPIRYQSFWKNEKGYQRPAELATVRLRSMVEVLSNFGKYVPDQSLLDWRGATYILDNTDNSVEYEYRNRGVLTYSATMKRPLSFLEPYIGKEKAMNPLGFSDEARR